MFFAPWLPPGQPLRLLSSTVKALRGGPVFDSHNCNLITRLVPYNQFDMAFDAPLHIETRVGSAPGTRIVTLNGPLTLRNMFELQAMLRGGEMPKLSILDLSGVPYLDSAGMGLLVNHFVHCQNHGAKFVAVGVCQRVLELFKITRVDSIIPQSLTVEAAEA